MTFALVVGSLVWLGALVVVLGAITVSVFAIRTRRPILALFGFVPLGLGLAAVVLDVVVPAPPLLPAVLAVALAALAIIGGNPVTVWVLNAASQGGVDEGAHGGILLPALPTGEPAKARAAKTREVLRGGTWIGYLERFAVVAAIAIGQHETIAAVIAIKGLGRFSELDTPEARERFIVGTLVSLIWAALCGALIVFGIFPGNAPR